MPITLTREQEHAVEANPENPTPVIDSQGKARFVLIPMAQYEAMVDDRDQAALRRDSLRNLAQRLKDDE